MISETTFLVLIIIEFALFLYMFLDLDNRLYGNIFAAGFGSLLGGLLALWSFNGNIGTSETVIASTTTNSSIGETLYTYSTQVTPLTDPTLGLFFVFLTIEMCVMLGYFAFEAWLEKMAPEEEDEY